MAIPKKIHYCWFGGNPKPKLAEKCIKSWKKYCPDYEIIEWNEDNFDVSQNDYCREAYEAKKWAFVTDYARLAILYEHGGVYFDTDVEIIKPIDEVLKEKCFMGIEKSTRCVEVATGLALGSEPGNSLIKEILEDYKDVHFLKGDGEFDKTTCTVRNTKILRKHGYQDIDITQDVAGAKIFSSEYFSPIEMESGKMMKTKNTYSIHHYSLSWTTEEKKRERKRILKRNKRQNFLHNLKTLPNRVLRGILGAKRYEKFKGKFGKGE